MAPREAAPPARYDEVRRKLHDLGYLEGRISRFVLRDPPGGVLGAAGKAALLGGPLLGGLLAGAAVAANRPLLRVLDALVLWLYFALLAGAALLALNVLAASVTAALARRRGVRAGDTVRASLLVALPTLAYLLLLWVWRPAGATLGADVAFLVAAGAATLFVAWLGGLVSLAGIIGRTGTVPDRARRPLISVVVVVIAAVALGVAARALAARGEDRGTPAAAFEIAAPAGRLLLVGVDGLDADLVEALEPDGAIEGLLRWMRAGAVFPLRRGAGQEPPQVWTTIATGMSEEVHGIRGAGVERLPGVATPLRREGSLPLASALGLLLPTRTVPASGLSRRVLALWEIASLQVRCASIGWWASWPASSGGEAQPGYVVTDRVLAKILAGREDDRDASPPGLYARLAGQFERDRSALRARFDARFAAVRDEQLTRIAWESFLIDAWHIEVARLVLQDPGVRALFLYVPGLDILRHRLPPASAGSAQAIAAQRAVALHVRWLAEELEALLSGVSDSTIVVVADPGRSAAPGTEGFVTVVGPRAQAGCVGPSASDLDVAPLALELLGFPASVEMRGRAPLACLRGAGPGVRRVATFGRKGIPAHSARGADDPQLLERLRSLGYIR